MIRYVGIAILTVLALSACSMDRARSAASAEGSGQYYGGGTYGSGLPDNRPAGKRITSRDVELNILVTDHFGKPLPKFVLRIGSSQAEQDVATDAAGRIKVLLRDIPDGALITFESPGRKGTAWKFSSGAAAFGDLPRSVQLKIEVDEDQLNVR